MAISANCVNTLSRITCKKGGAENAGMENAGVEKSGAMTDGEPSVKKTIIYQYSVGPKLQRIDLRQWCCVGTDCTYL